MSETLKTKRTYRFRAYVSAQTHRNIDEVCERLRWLWNDALALRKNAYELRKEKITKYDTFEWIKDRTHAEPGKWDWFPSDAKRCMLTRLDEAFEAFFRRVKAGGTPGYPKFKRHDQPVKSFEVRGKKIHYGPNWNSVAIKGVGRIRFKGAPTEGKVKLIRLLWNARRVEIHFVCETEAPAPTDDRPPMGIDVGCIDRVALNDGTTFPGVKPDKTRKVKLQKSLSRKVKGSKSRGRARHLLAKEEHRIACRERNALHQLTAKLVKDYSARFYVEDLRIPNMVKNHVHAESIHDQRWGEFFRQLTYKCEAGGGWVRKVAAPNTSRICSECGEAGKPGRRTFECGHCGYVDHRDVNAAKNVLSRGLNPRTRRWTSRGTTRRKKGACLAPTLQDRSARGQAPRC